MTTEHAVLIAKLRKIASRLGDKSYHDEEETVFDAIVAIEELSYEVGSLEAELAYGDGAAYEYPKTSN